MTQRHPPIAPDDPVGLCARCRHARIVATPRAKYRLCGLAATDPSYDKYPRLPVRACPGFERGEEAGQDPEGRGEGPR